LLNKQVQYEEELLMERFLHFAPLVLILLSACGSIPGLNPAATPTPTATHTPEPTFTPLPTDTSTPSPTATPDEAATAAAEATQGAGDVLAELDQRLGETDIPYKEGHLAWQQTEPLTVSLSGPDYSFLEIDDKLTAGNFILKSDVTWNASGILICGAVFRSEPDIEQGKQYMFSYLRLSGLPAWAIEVHEFGRYKNSPTDVKFSDALDLANGATNQFVLVAQEEQFTITSTAPAKANSLTIATSVVTDTLPSWDLKIPGRAVACSKIPGFGHWNERWKSMGR